MPSQAGGKPPPRLEQPERSHALVMVTGDGDDGTSNYVTHEHRWFRISICVFAPMMVSIASIVISINSMSYPAIREYL